METTLPHPEPNKALLGNQRIRIGIDHAARIGYYRGIGPTPNPRAEDCLARAAGPEVFLLFFGAASPESER